MRAVVTTGTATSIADTSIAGKTGTAEYGTGNPLPTEAWFTGYLGAYAVTVLVQDGGYGGDAAAPLAAEFLTGIQPAPAAKAGAPA
jgi:cell division protein FtsI/penicillin-binding protein 2